MKQFYWTADGPGPDESLTGLSGDIRIPQEGYKYEQGVPYCIKYTELTESEIQLDNVPDYNFTINRGNYSFSNNDLIRLRLVDKSGETNNYQDIFYGEYSELVNQEYLIFVPLVTFLNGDISVTNITQEINMDNKDGLYFPYENLILENTDEEEIDNDHIYLRHYYVINDTKYYGFNIYKVDNWYKENGTIKIESIEKTEHTKCVLMVNNQIYTQDYLFETETLPFPDRVYSLAILNADGVWEDQEGNRINDTCVIINYN